MALAALLRWMFPLPLLLVQASELNVGCKGLLHKAAAEEEDMDRFSAAASVASLSLLQMAAAKAPATSMKRLDEVIDLGSPTLVTDATQKLASELEKRGLNIDYAELNIEQTMEKLALEERLSEEGVGSEAGVAAQPVSRDKEPLGLLGRSTSLVSAGLFTATRQDVELEEALRWCGCTLAFSIIVVVLYSLVRLCRYGDDVWQTLFNCGKLQAAVWLAGVVLLVLASVAPLVIPWLTFFVGTGAVMSIYESQSKSLNKASES